MRDYSAVAHNRIAYNKVYHSEYGFMMGGNDWLVENNEVNRLCMYPPGRNDDCDYSRFFGKGCVERCNYYHGSSQKEIKTAHVDCIQTFTDNGEIAKDLLFEYNTCFDFHQGCMVESAPHIGSVRDLTFRHNISCPNSPKMRGRLGPGHHADARRDDRELHRSPRCAWSCIGLRGKESTSGQIRNNILCEARAGRRGLPTRRFTPSKPVIEYNLTYKTWALDGATNINGKDPLFVDPAEAGFPLAQGQPGHRRGQGRHHGRGHGIAQRLVRGPAPSGGGG